MSKWRATFDFVLKYFPPIAGLTTVIGTVVYALGGEPPDDIKRALLALGIMVGVLLISIFVTTFFYISANTRASSSNERLAAATLALSNDSKRFVKILSHMNDLLEVDFQYCKYIGDYAQSADPALIKKEFARYLDDLLFHTVAMMEDYTGTKCAACIKQLHVSADKDPAIESAPCPGETFEYVYTLHRDQGSRLARRKADRKGTRLYIYPFVENSAFTAILGKPGEFNSFFTMDDLQSRPPSEYKNTNPDWPKHYNAVAVTALAEPGADSPLPHTLGFLCVDNMTGGFDDHACRQLLECIASIAYYSIQGTNDVLNEKRRTIS